MSFKFPHSLNQIYIKPLELSADHYKNSLQFLNFQNSIMSTIINDLTTVNNMIASISVELSFVKRQFYRNAIKTTINNIDNYIKLANRGSIIQPFLVATKQTDELYTNDDTHTINFFNNNYTIYEMYMNNNTSNFSNYTFNRYIIGSKNLGNGINNTDKYPNDIFMSMVQNSISYPLIGDVSGGALSYTKSLALLSGDYTASIDAGDIKTLKITCVNSATITTLFLNSYYSFPNNVVYQCTTEVAPYTFIRIDGLSITNTEVNILNNIFKNYYSIIRTNYPIYQLYMGSINSPAVSPPFTATLTITGVVTNIFSSANSLSNSNAFIMIPTNIGVNSINIAYKVQVNTYSSNTWTISRVDGKQITSITNLPIFQVIDNLYDAILSVQGAPDFTLNQAPNSVQDSSTDFELGINSSNYQQYSNLVQGACSNLNELIGLNDILISQVNLNTRLINNILPNYQISNTQTNDVINNDQTNDDTKN